MGKRKRARAAKKNALPFRQNVKEGGGGGRWSVRLSSAHACRQAETMSSKQQQGNNVQSPPQARQEETE